MPGQAVLFVEENCIRIGGEVSIVKSIAPIPMPLPVESSVAFGPYLIKMSKYQSNIVPPAQKYLQFSNIQHVGF